MMPASESNPELAGHSFPNPVAYMDSLCGRYTLPRASVVAGFRWCMRIDKRGECTRGAFSTDSDKSRSH